MPQSTVNCGGGENGGSRELPHLMKHISFGGPREPLFDGPYIKTVTRRNNNSGALRLR